MDAESSHVFDYRQGKGGWGHAIHSITWRPIPARSTTTGRLWWKKTVTTPERVSVMVHAQRWPREGDRLLMSGKSGADWNLKIVDVEPCGNPRDMFTVTLEDDGAARATGPASPQGDSGRDHS
jgi:hypothetical protein